METNIWQYLLPALCGIITGAVVPVVLQWRGKRAEAKKVEADAKRIEDEITERVLSRAKEEINGLSKRNSELTCEVEQATKKNTVLARKVRQLEQKCIIMQENQEKLRAFVDSLKDGVLLLCKQLSNAGIEPAFVLDGVDEVIIGEPECEG